MAHSKFPINLFEDLLVVKPYPINPSTIRLPDWKRTLYGVVVATGSTVKAVTPGDRVCFGAAVGMDSVFNGDEVRILREKDLDFIYEAE